MGVDFGIFILMVSTVRVIVLALGKNEGVTVILSDSHSIILFLLSQHQLLEIGLPYFIHNKMIYFHKSVSDGKGIYATHGILPRLFLNVYYIQFFIVRYWK